MSESGGTHALPLMVGVLCVLTIAYRYYSAFLAAKVACLDETRVTPAHEKYDGQNFYPTNRWVLFGHHFAAIAGAGPLIGPVLAAQFGFLPGLLWIVIGVTLAGAVQDFIVMAASVRRGGRSLAEIATTEVSPRAGFTAAIAILFIIVVALAGLGLSVVNALAESAWGTFTIACSVPIGLLMGFYMYVWRKGAIVSGSVMGVLALLAAVLLGHEVAGSSYASWFHLSRTSIVIAIAAYGFVASVLPVWMLLCPRDYLSSYMKLGTIAFLVFGIFIVNPELKFPAVTKFVDGGGPIVPGKVFPFVFITIACGAISGFHALVASGTTPKMIANERDVRPIAYGAMLMEGLVGVTALIAACCLEPGDYYAVNTAPEKFAALGMHAPNLAHMAELVGEANLAGRTGGAVSLALGMSSVFTALPGMSHLMSYWYHFAIMFEALFILTTIDTGTRVARFLVQEFIGRVWKPFARTDWLPGSLISTGLVVVAWATFLYSGEVSTIWPMFGIANQLLACVALAVGTTVIVNEGRARYAWVTLAPMCFLATTTISAGVLSISGNFWPLWTSGGPRATQGLINTGVTGVMLVCVLVIFVEAGRACWRARGRA